MNGSMLKGARPPLQSRAVPAGAPSGAMLRSGPPSPQQLQQQGQGQGGDDQSDAMLSGAIAEVLEAAKSQGFTMPEEGVPPEQLPQVYEQMLQAAAKSDMGATDGGIQMLVEMSKALQVRSPFHRDFNAPPAARGGPVGPSGKPRPLEREPDYAMGGEAPGALPPGEEYNYPYKR